MNAFERSVIKRYKAMKRRELSSQGKRALYDYNTADNVLRHMQRVQSGSQAVALKWVEKNLAGAMGNREYASLPSTAMLNYREYAKNPQNKNALQKAINAVQAIMTTADRLMKTFRETEGEMQGREAKESAQAQADRKKIISSATQLYTLVNKALTLKNGQLDEWERTRQAIMGLIIRNTPDSLFLEKPLFLRAVNQTLGSGAWRSALQAAKANARQTVIASRRAER